MDFLEQIKSYSFYQDILDQQGEVYLVGGCVRDKLLRRQVKDLDLVIRKIPLNQF